MDHERPEGDMVEIVRTELLRIKQDQGLTNELLASRIKRPDGRRYPAKTVGKFLRDEEPARDWGRFALAAASGWRIGRLEFRPTRRPRR